MKSVIHIQFKSMKQNIKPHCASPLLRVSTGSRSSSISLLYTCLLTPDANLLSYCGSCSKKSDSPFWPGPGGCTPCS